MNKQVDVAEPAVIFSPRAHNYLRWESAREIWLSLSPGRTIWELATEDEIESMISDIIDSIIE